MSRQQVTARNETHKNRTNIRKWAYCIFFIQFTTATQNFWFDNSTARRFGVTDRDFPTQEPQFSLKMSFFYASSAILRVEDCSSTPMTRNCRIDWKKEWMSILDGSEMMRGWSNKMKQNERKLGIPRVPSLQSKLSEFHWWEVYFPILLSHLVTWHPNGDARHLLHIFPLVISISDFH
jgi:hypothetical protein